MKLLVNASSLVAPLSGIGRYTQQLLLQLLSEPDIEDIQAFNALNIIKADDLKTLLKSFDYDRQCKKIKPSIMALPKKYIRKIGGLRALKQYRQKHILSKKFRDNGTSIYWEPNYILTPYDGIKVATIHDLSHIHYPEFHPLDRIKWLTKKLPETIENSDALIAVSEFSKREIMAYFGTPEEKISIVSPAVAPIFRQQHSTLQIQQFKHKLQLPDHYVLSVGTLEPRKNIKGLVQAYSLLPLSLRKKYPLVIVGAKGWHTEEMDSLFQPLLSHAQLILLGYVAQQYLPLLYAGATVFAYISHYEGYGMPIAEAMCSNTVVLTSNIASMPEVAANSAQLVNPKDIDKVSEHLEELLTDPIKRACLQQQAIEVSNAYCWESSSHNLVNLFKQLNSNSYMGV